MPTKITPTLYIGLGGTGARALLRAKQCFMDAYGKVPSMIEFLAIDTDSRIGGEPIKSHIHGDITLSRNETLYITESNALRKYLNFPEDFDWVPSQNSNKLKNIQGSGAGQVRSNGRFILQENINSVKTAIIGKVNNITKALNLGGKFIPATKNDGSLCPAIINVVGSVAGGTGCGMMVDMLQVVSSALDGLSGVKSYIYPWIIMPDIYRSLYPRMSDAVYLNAYGALREMDYLFNLSVDNRNPLRIGNENITSLGERISYAYLINNYNAFAGTIESDAEIADNVGRSMFLPTNDMGAAVATPMDNIRNWKDNFDLQAEGKSCWCASTGSAEIVYDSQVVGDCIGYSLIRSVANQLRAITDANATGQLVQQWMVSPEVSIQERDADQLIDSFLNENYLASMSFDLDSSESDINNFISLGTNVKDELDRKYNEIKLRVESELGKKVTLILNSAHGVGDAAEFLNQLSKRIELCEEDMHKEIGEHTQFLNSQQPWSLAIKSIKGTNFIGRPKLDEEAAEALSQTISLYIMNKRNLLRKQYALNVYSSLHETIDNCQRDIAVFKDKLDKLSNLMTQWIESNKQEAAKQSLFKITLHKDTLNLGRNSDQNDSLNFVSHTKVTDLLSAVNEKGLFDLLKPWADSQQEVQTAFAKSIDQVLGQMSEDKVKELLLHVKKMSSPMWNVDFGGYLRSPKDIINMFIVGCDDAFNNIILNKKEYAELFESSDGAVRPYFASIGGKNRIQILTLSCCAPIYSLGNTLSYKKEYDEKSVGLAGYIDQKWNQRMLSENFQIIPIRKNVGPNPLEIWVKSIVLGLIQYDNDKNQYWLESKEHGLPRRGYRFDLAANRETAYDAFKNMGLYKENKGVIDDMVTKQGKETIQAIFDKVTHRNYYDEFSIMSDRDKSHIEEDIYKVLQDLIDSEIAFIADGGLKI